MMKYRDDYGRFEIQAEHEFDGVIYQWRKYDNSPMIKKLGGCYANYCEAGAVKFYRSEYLRDRAFVKFMNTCIMK